MNTRTILLGAMLGVCSATYGQTRQQLDIEHATVFLRSAELMSTVKVNLVKGENEFIFSNVATNINTGSVQIQATNGVAVQGVVFQNVYQQEAIKPGATKTIADSIKLLERRKPAIVNRIAVVDEQISTLKENRRVTDKTLTNAELEKRLELAGKKLQEYLDRKTRDEDLLDEIDEQVARLNERQTEAQKGKPVQGGQLQVKLYATAATASTLTITYIMPDAGWAPIYDIMAADIKSPVKLYYKANIYQRGGVNWDNVKLTLSTGNPQEGMQAPVVNPVYVTLYTPPKVQSEVVVAYKRPLVDKYTNQTADLVASTPGVYQSRRGAAINSDGGRATGNLYVIDGVQVAGQNSMANYVNVSNDGVNSTFDIDLAYTIPCDGQMHLVAVNKYDVPATYQYYVAPKFDRDAFLVANITNWQDLNLLPGQSNIFYEGTFLGQGFINPQQVSDTMRISLGRDKKIIVKREQDKTLRSTHTIGSNVKDHVAFTTTIRNTRKEPISIVMEDQLPVSNNTSIEIQDMEAADAEHTQETGLLKWRLTVAPNDVKKTAFAYTLKYPKGSVVQ